MGKKAKPSVAPMMEILNGMYWSVFLHDIMSLICISSYLWEMFVVLMIFDNVISIWDCNGIRYVNCH